MFDRKIDIEIDIEKLWRVSGESEFWEPIERMSLGEMLGGVGVCPYCGRAHKAGVRSADIGASALDKLPARLREISALSAYVIADETTYSFVPDVLRRLEAAGVSHSTHVISSAEPVPDEAAIGAILMDFEAQAGQIIIGVGSGVINDLARLISFRLGVPYGIVATAPSMDGFASSVAPLIRGRLKKTYAAHSPIFIIGDKRLLDSAPVRLKAAGVSDVLGKINSLVDWKIASLVTGEIYCPWVASLMRVALTRVIKLAESGGDISVKLMEALVIAGLAMAFNGDSRPASGFEHHIAHTWEMMFLSSGLELAPHGVKVGIATVIAMRLARELARFDWTAEKPIDKELWKLEIQRVFKEASGEIISLEEALGKNDAESICKRRKAAFENRDAIVGLLESMPMAEDVSNLITKSGGVASPNAAGISKKQVRDALLYAKEVRGRFTLLQLAYDVGFMPEFVDQLIC